MVFEAKAHNAHARVRIAHVVGLYDRQVDEIIAVNQALGDLTRLDVHGRRERCCLGGTEGIASVGVESNRSVDTLVDKRCLRHLAFVQAVGDIVNADVCRRNSKIEQGLNHCVHRLDEGIDVWIGPAVVCSSMPGALDSGLVDGEVHGMLFTAQDFAGSTTG